MNGRWFKLIDKVGNSNQLPVGIELDFGTLLPFIAEVSEIEDSTTIYKRDGRFIITIKTQDCYMRFQEIDS